MAVDYTKLFTVVGSYLARINTYFPYIATFETDQATVEDVLASQTLVRMGDGLSTNYLSFKQNVTSWINTLIQRVSVVLTDDELVGSNFPFGTTTSLNVLWPALLKDMDDNNESVDPSTSTVGTPDYTAVNGSDVGPMIIGTLLDGVSSPITGGPVIPIYAGVETQMTPDEETLTLTCTTDSENGALRGSETFSVTGTLGGSSPYSAGGENIGQLGNIQMADGQSTLISNGSFDSWTSNIPDGWNEVDGVTGTHYQKGSQNLRDFETGFSFQTKPNTVGGPFILVEQTISASRFQRNRAYFISLWAMKNTDVGTDQDLTVTLKDENDTNLGGITITGVTGTAVWNHFSSQFVIPAQLIGDVTITITASSMSAASDPTSIDQIVIVPCQYFAGVALAVFDGKLKYLMGDQISLSLTNDSLGLYQAFFRKAFKMQLPTSDTPSISEILVS